jgi:hypothetical protein
VTTRPSIRAVGWTVLLSAALVGCGDSDDDRPTAASSSTHGGTEPTATTVPASAVTSSPSSALTRHRLDFDRLGPITLGMTHAEAERAAGVRLFEDRLSPESDCVTWGPRDGSESVYFLAVDRRLAIIEVGAPIVTVDGLGAGATREDIVAVYGPERVRESTNRFQIHEITVTPSSVNPGGHAIVFQLTTGGTTVERIRAALATELQQRDEGCA